MPAVPKPEPYKRVKQRRRRQERNVVTTVREQCVERDGYCRWRGCGLGECVGASEWAHLGDKKRFKTRGMDPEERHTTAGSLMMCKAHHDAYDKGSGQDRLRIIPLVQRLGADSALQAERNGVIYVEDMP